MYTTFIINLEKDSDRMQFMADQMRALDMTYIRQEAVNGKTYQPTVSEYNEEIIKQKKLHLLLPGELGCALSHKQTYEQIVADDLPYALILEDDVSLPPNFKQIIEDEINRNADQWEYLLFDYPTVGVPYIKKWLHSIIENYHKIVPGRWLSRMHFIVYSFLKGLYIIPLSAFEGIRDHYKKQSPGPVLFYRPVYFAGAYLVSKTGVKKLLSLAHPIMYTADQLPNRARIKSGLRFMCYAPRIVIQNKTIFGSSILDVAGKDMKCGYEK